MEMPFTTEQFFQVFESYNTTLFPAQLLLLLLGLLAAGILHRPVPSRNKFLGGFLGLLWLWTGIAYHFSFFAAVNPAAYGFGGLFLLQGAFFLLETWKGERLQFAFHRNFQGYLGYFFLWFGLILYPAIGYGLEKELTRTISLGLPCPTTIFTFGLLMLTTGRFARYLLILPTLWALIGTFAAMQMGVYQDYIMPVAAAIALFLLIRNPSKNKKA